MPNFTNALPTPAAAARGYAPISQHEEAQPGSSLTNRATSTASAGPRVGLLGRIGATARNVLRCLRSVRSPGTARRANLTRRQTEFAQKLHSVQDAVLSRTATSHTVKDAFMNARAAGLQLRACGGAPRERMRQTFSQMFESADSAQLNRLATAFGGKAVADAQQLLADDDGAVHMLMEMELALNAELEKRSGQAVDTAIQTAVEAVQGGKSPERVADHLHSAFDSAAPLARLGVMRPNDRSTDTATAIDARVADCLDSLPEDTRGALLMHLGSSDLKRLHWAVAGSGGPINTALKTEITARPARLEAQVREHAQRLQEIGAAPGAVRRGELMSELAAITLGLKALGQHRADFGVPQRFSTELTHLKQSVAAATEQVLRSGRLDPGKLTAPEVTVLTAAFAALESPGVAHELLGQAQSDALRQQKQDFDRSLGKLLGALANMSDPESLLWELTWLEEISSQIHDTTNTFAVSTPTRLDAAAIEDEIMRESVGKLSKAQRDKLAQAVSSPDFQPLLAGLHEAERAARDAHEVTLANRFANMASLLSGIAWQIDPLQEESADASPARAQDLPAPMRQAFNKVYGVTLSGQGTTLNAGHFNAQQIDTLAGVLEESLGSEEAKLTPLGDRMVGAQFLKDLRRGRPLLFVEAGSTTVNRAAQTDAADRPRTMGTAPTVHPLIDYNKWPGDDVRTQSDAEAAKTGAHVDGLIADGYERLLDFCGGDEKEAQMLSFHLQQNRAAPLQVACAGPDSPLRLPDGTPGYISINNHGGGGDQIAVTLSRGSNGRPQLDVDYQYLGRNLFQPADGSDPIELSADSVVQLHYRAELDNGVLRLLTPPPPSYKTAVRPDDFQKMYQPPTAASIRRAFSGDATGVLLDAVEYSETIGKDYQIKALRAADAFQQQPTLQNAIAVISECDKGGPEAASLVPPEVRQSVQAAVENNQQGVLAAFDAVIPAARQATRQIARQAVEGPVDLTVQPGLTYVAGQILKKFEQLRTKTGVSLLEGAEKLYREYIEQPEEGSERAGDHLTFPVNPNVAAEAGNRLAAQRERMAQPAFDSDLFGTLADTLAQRLDAEVLPGMIEAVKRGEIQ